MLGSRLPYAKNEISQKISLQYIKIHQFNAV
jgi:hypothetical protein